MKKLFLTLALFSPLLLAGTVMAQIDQEYEAITSSQLAKQPPLNATDLQLFIKLATGINKLKSAPDRLAFMEKFLWDNNTSLIRVRYISEKVPYVLRQVRDPNFKETSGRDKRWLKPTANELKLVQDNQDELHKALQSR
ncbi:MAG: hypothetical protein LBS60_07035 [Deltaproteobacteria bacterium]|jgi:hypothetical protein|nr:hypothetical protein [Deltaproteobacteria bacterium]